MLTIAEQMVLKSRLTKTKRRMFFFLICHVWLYCLHVENSSIADLSYLFLDLYVSSRETLQVQPEEFNQGKS